MCVVCEKPRHLLSAFIHECMTSSGDFYLNNWIILTYMAIVVSCLTRVGDPGDVMNRTRQEAKSGKVYNCLQTSSIEKG